MDSLKLWLTSICIGAIGIGIFKMLIPNGAMNKVMKTICAVFMLSIIIYPLSQNIKFDIDDIDNHISSIESGDTLTGTMNDIVMERARVAYEKDVVDILSQNQVPQAKIEILMDTSEDGSIIINQVVIYIETNQMYKSEQIINDVEKTLGFKAVVHEYEVNQNGY